MHFQDSLHHSATRSGFKTRTKTVHAADERDLGNSVNSPVPSGTGSHGPVSLRKMEPGRRVRSWSWGFAKRRHWQSRHVSPYRLSPTERPRPPA